MEEEEEVVVHLSGTTVVAQVCFASFSLLHSLTQTPPHLDTVMMWSLQTQARPY